MPHEPVDRNVTVPGGAVFVRTWTPADPLTSEPLILLHDSIGSVELWRDWPLDLLKAVNRPVIAYDRLGFGRSSPREGLPSLAFIREEAAFFPHLLEALEIDTFKLFGYSVGGTMALTIASRMPGRCRAVVTESAQAFVEERTIEGVKLARERFRQPEQMERLRKWHGDKAQWVLDAWTEVWLAPARAGWSVAPDLPGVQCPVLVIHGDLDDYGSRAFPEMIHNLTGGPSEMAVLEGCGHMPHRERREAVLEMCRRFFAGQPIRD